MCFHSYASRIGSKFVITKSGKLMRCKGFPFIRFTNWKQDSSDAVAIYRGILFPFIRFTNWKQDSARGGRWPCLAQWFPFIRFTNWKQGITSITAVLTWYYSSFHSYASRIGSKALGSCVTSTRGTWSFPFIRFKNWKQATNQNMLQNWR